MTTEPATDQTLRSYCTLCDSETCEEHRGTRRYLDPIEYVELRDPLGKLVGYRVPDHERKRWNNPVKGTPPSRVTPNQVRPIQELVVELEGWCDLTSIERLLRDLYETEPVRVTRLSQHVIEGAKTGQLRNPGGLLVTKLRSMRS